jgi:ribonucleoside-diphosphate reductase alpha chain
MRFEPQGYTKNPDIKIAKSLIDYIFRWLGMTFLPGYKEASMGVLPAAEVSVDAAAEDAGSSGPSGSSSGVQGSGFRVRDKASKPGSPVADEAGPKPETAKSTHSSAVGLATPKTAIKPTADSRQPIANGHSNGHATGNGDAGAKNYSAILLARAGVLVKGADGPNTARSEQFAEFQSDAPACDNCGAITVRNGNCYLCHNCGSSMGCS